MVKSLKRGLYSAVNGLGYELKKIQPNKFSNQTDAGFYIDTKGLRKIQYGCGTKLLKDWVNVDSLPVELLAAWRSNQMPDADQNPVGQFFYRPLDLTSRQPFADNSFEYGFCEDFIEHLTQAESITFLSECFRVLKPGGILRMSFPGLEGVLKNHYFGPTSYQSANEAKKDCYDQWEHIHFYSREELRLVATHLGYSHVAFTTYGNSTHAELKDLETRANQDKVNTYVELQK
ncbi:methyltransferase domain-containing protein [Spirosoma sp. BT702]|uniref:Methyltransferase domain-containing protein n=1 Tax=Spirosoma profusum TaxID=2771354 RepID=A0A926XVT8_9BACT|nr:methyltransferase domain-containing protein [Spirosoma profusum]MBD2700681.1 methyltransferase domain-containing protein [Spirosoma profusum]